LRVLTRRFTSNYQESSDLVQDTILRALTYQDKFRDDINLKGWLFTIMRNTFINNYRKKRRFRTKEDHSNELSLLRIQDVHTFNIPDASIEYSDILAMVHSLKPGVGAPLKMFMRGFKYYEIAEHFGMPLGTVKNRIFQARQEVQKHLDA